MSKSKFKVGQVISFPPSSRIGKRQRHGGTITKVETMYELKEDKKYFYPNGVCRGELTTIKELSKGEPKGFAYTVRTIQPQNFTAEIVAVEENKVNLSSKQKIIESYSDTTGKIYTK
tara:strand:- start:260 stop:610 length:351 start_codon:yes stop_codon:yes gene_type:complete